MITPERGRYLVLEGGDGCGKTTQLDLAAKALIEKGREVHQLTEPGGTNIGERLRDLILDPLNEAQPQSDFDLFTVCRREICVQVLGPLMLKGVVALSGRNWLSSIAYQGWGERMDVNYIIARSKEATGKFFIPDGVVILDIPVELAEERRRSRGEIVDHFEQRDTDFHRRVRDGYLWAAEKFSIPVLDASQSKEQVHQDVVTQLKI